MSTVQQHARPDALVREIRELYAAGDCRLIDLSEHYGISVATLGDWISGLRRQAAGGPITPAWSRPHPNKVPFDQRYTEDADGCWLWQGTRNERDYGKLSYNGRFWFAHRLAWTLANGPIPGDLTVDHLCFNPPCVNPAHLRLLTNEENAGNQRSALSATCKRGHEFTPENTYSPPSQRGRSCRICIRAGRERLLRPRGAAA